MRSISADLADVQKVRSARARVQCTVEERGATQGLPAVAWKQLVANSSESTFRAVALVDTSDGKMLRFRDVGTTTRQDTINNPTSATNWTTPSVNVQIFAHSCFAIAALRVPNTASIYLFYINANNGNVYLRLSADNGATWTAADTVYSGGDAVADLVVTRVDDPAFVAIDWPSASPWFVGFSTLNSGVYRAHYCYGAAFGGWMGDTYPFDYWRAAGIANNLGGLTSPGVRCLMYRQRFQGISRLREVTYDGSVFTSPNDIDMTSAGYTGLVLSGHRFVQLPQLGAQVAVANESGFGHGAFEGVSGLFYDGELLTDEAVMLPRYRTLGTVVNTGIGAVGNDVYMAGRVGVYRGAWQGAVTGETLVPIRYDYDENVLDIDFPVTAGSQTLKVGQILRLDRTLSWGAKSGTQSIRFYIVKVERATDKVGVVAVDALGFMGSSRLRRSTIVSEGSGGVAKAMRRTAGRIGLGVDVDNAALESAPVLGLTVGANENLLSAAYRIGSQSEWYLVPANDGSFRLSMITPGTSDSGEYNDTAHQYGQAGNESVVYRAAELTDFRQLGFSQVLGTASTDPQDGSALGMADGAWVANTRPISFTLTNRNYNSFTRVGNAAAAEGARQKKLDINAEMTTAANLGLELFDMVAVTESRLGWSARLFRVRRIHERWQDGKLTQRVWMGSED